MCITQLCAAFAGLWAPGLSALRAKSQGHHGLPWPAESSWAQRGQSTEDRAHGAPVEVQAWVLLGLGVVGDAILETKPTFSLWGRS